MVIGTSFCSEAGGGQERNAAPAAHGLNATLLFVAHVNFESVTGHNLNKSLKIFKNGNLLLLDLIASYSDCREPYLVLLAMKLNNRPIVELYRK